MLVNGEQDHAPSLGILEIRRAASNAGTWLQPQTDLPRVLRSWPESAPAYKAQVAWRPLQPLSVPEQQDQVWSADFMSDALYYGTRFRTFNPPLGNSLRPTPPASLSYELIPFEWTHIIGNTDT